MLKLNLKTAVTAWKFFQGQAQGQSTKDTIKNLPTSSIQPDIIEVMMKRANIAADQTVISMITSLAEQFPGKTIGEMFADPSLPDQVMALLTEADKQIESEQVEVFEIPHICPACKSRHHLRVVADFLGEGNLVGVVPLKDIQLPKDPWAATTYMRTVRIIQPQG